MSLKISLLIILNIVSLVGMFIGLLKWKKSDNISYKYLSTYFLLFFVIFFSSLLLNVFGRETSNHLVIFVSYLFFPALLSIAPLQYLYLKTLDLAEETDNPIINWLPHFSIPGSLLIINCFVFVAFSQMEQTGNNFELLDTAFKLINFIALFFVFLVQNIVYGILSFKEYKILDKKYAEEKENIKPLAYVKRNIVGFLFICFLVYLFQLNFLSDYKIIMRISLLIYTLWLLFNCYKPHKFKELVVNTSFLQQDQKLLLKNRITKAMEEEKVFTDNNLSLQSFAKMVNSNSKYVSKLINEEYDMNVSSYINTYRIEEAKAMLSNPENSVFTMEYIASIIGYSSKSSFYNSFKKITGMTPTEYKKNKT